MDAHLIVKLGGIGDVVMALPAAKRLQEKMGGEIHWVCGTELVSLLELFPFVNRVIAVENAALFNTSSSERIRETIRVWKLLVGMHYNTCAVLQYDWRYSVLTLPVRAERRIRLSHTKRTQGLIAGRYHGDEYTRILLGEDYSATDRLPALRIGGRLPPPLLVRSERKRIAIVPGGARNALRDDPQRRWPLSHYVELSASLAARGYEVVLVGGSADREVTRMFSGVPVVDLVGRLKLAELLSCFETCDLVISHDTGPFHLAALTSAAVLALFGPVNPAERLPNRPDIRYFWGGSGLACRPCYDGRDFAVCSNNRCMTEIRPAAVINAAEEMLNVRTAGTQKLHATLV